MTATFHLSSTPSSARLRVDGELDVESRGPLAWRLLDLEQLECTRYQLDLGNVTHVDSSCLRLIDDARGRILTRGAEFDVVSASLCFRLLTRVGGYAALASETERPRVPAAARGRLGWCPTTTVGRRSPADHGKWPGYPRVRGVPARPLPTTRSDGAWLQVRPDSTTSRST
jgi:ABC-type transporter Mla MlaB component